MKYTKFLYIIAALLSISCKKFIDVSAPITSPVAELVFREDESAISTLSGLYTKISQENIVFPGTIPSLSLYLGLSSDEFTLSPDAYSPQLLAYYQNSLNSSVAGYEYWPIFYSYIYSCNDIIENLEKSNTLTPTIKTQLLGEAKFMRAFSYFYLVNLYGDLPLVLTTDYKTNIQLPRIERKVIYDQIIKDLKDAKTQLSDQFLDGKLTKQTFERVRPTKWSASALLARVYLYLKDYANAETESSTIISQTDLFKLESCENAFLKNNQEAIWQIQPVDAAIPNTSDALAFIIPPTGMSQFNPVSLSNLLIGSFELGDKRRTDWIDSVEILGQTYYYPYKYKINSYQIVGEEYLTVFRLAEQYLIRSEARIKQNKIEQALEDLNEIRNRANLTKYSITNQVSIFNEITLQRQLELFSEFGHRWLDIKRMNTIDNIMNEASIIKGTTWSSYKSLFPLQLNEDQKAPNIKQNPGYN